MNIVNTLPAKRFERTERIRFGHCDPGGIVFYPQYLVLFNALVEDWFTDGLGVSYADMLGRRKIGLPIIKLACDFRAISNMGDDVTFCLSVARLGGSSLTLDVDCRGPGPDGVERVRVSAHKVLVFTSLETHRSISVPPDLRAAIQSWSEITP